MTAIGIHARCATLHNNTTGLRETFSIKQQERAQLTEHGQEPAQQTMLSSLHWLISLTQDMHSQQKFERYQKFGLKMVWLLLPNWRESSVWKAWDAP